MRLLNDLEMRAIAGGVMQAGGGHTVVVHHTDEDGNEWDEQVYEADGGGGDSSDPSEQNKALTDEQKASNERIRQAQKDADAEAEKAKEQDQKAKDSANLQKIADNIDQANQQKQADKCTNDKTGDIATAAIKIAAVAIPYIGKTIVDEVPKAKPVTTPSCDKK